MVSSLLLLSFNNNFPVLKRLLLPCISNNYFIAHVLMQEYVWILTLKNTSSWKFHSNFNPLPPALMCSNLCILNILSAILSTNRKQIKREKLSLFLYSGTLKYGRKAEYTFSHILR